MNATEAVMTRDCLSQDATSRQQKHVILLFFRPLAQGSRLEN